MEKIADLYLADHFKNPVRERSEAQAPIRLSEQEMIAKTGVYWDEEEIKFIRVYLKDGKLRLASLASGNHYDLLPLDKNRFQILGFPDQLYFGPPDVNKPQWVKQIDVYDEVTGYLAANPPELTKVQLEEYVGAYRSEELRSRLTIALIKDRLRLRIEGESQAKWEPLSLEGTDLELQPLFVDTFRCGNYCYLNFMRNSQRKVTGLKFSFNGARHLLFSRPE